MSDSYRKLHGDAYSEWKEQKTTEYMENQREAFMAGFEAAAKEGQEFNHLREWLREQRDEAIEKYEERDDDMMFARQMAYKEVLTKLSEMGCRTNE